MPQHAASHSTSDGEILSMAGSMIENSTVQNSFRRASEVIEEAGGIETGGPALLSQEGSVIACFAMTRGVVPQTKCLGMHS